MSPLNFLTRYSVSQQIGVAVMGAVLLIVLSALVAWLSLGTIKQVQEELLQQQIPQQQFSLQIARQAADLATAIAVLANTEDPVYLQQNLQIAEQQQSLLFKTIREFQPEQIQVELDQFARLTTQLGRQTQTKLDIHQTLQQNMRRVTALELEIQHALTTAIDDHLFFVLTGLRELSDKPGPVSQSASDIMDLHRLDSIQAEHNQSGNILAALFTITDVSFSKPLREKFEASTAAINRAMQGLQLHQISASARQQLEQIQFLGLGERGLFNTFTAYLQKSEQQQVTFREYQTLVEHLLADSDRLIEDSVQQTKVALGDAEASIYSGYALVLSFAMLSLIGAAIYSWYYVRQVLTQRLISLAHSMQTMATGDLSQPVPISGQDEIAQMGKALDVFRRHALEVQRLNLVEQLAGELEEKNQHLQDTVSQLNKAQEQIVLREKLSALGELTAGVAHEIKNPLNFVNNFSATSVDLLHELEELIEDSDHINESEDAEEFAEILTMLTANMEKITSHGKRADSIVNSMLSLGRTESDEASSVALQPLAQEHAALAWHSVRAANPDFSGEITYHFPDRPLYAEVVPQDLSRVILNLVTNACHACWERHQQAEPDYRPQIVVSGEVNENWVDISVSDNGTGIDDQIMDQIFVPFFTTKATDLGTGLGLSMSYDLVKKQGGELSVQSKISQGSRFTIRLPLLADLSTA